MIKPMTQRRGGERWRPALAGTLRSAGYRRAPSRQPPSLHRAAPVALADRCGCRRAKDRRLPNGKMDTSQEELDRELVLLLTSAGQAGPEEAKSDDDNGFIERFSQDERDPDPALDTSSLGSGDLVFNVHNDGALAKLVLAATAALRPGLAADLRRPRNVETFNVQPKMLKRYKNDYVPFPGGEDRTPLLWDIFCPNKMPPALPKLDGGNVKYHIEETKKHGRNKEKWRTALLDAFPDKPSEVTENEVQRVVLDRRNHFERLLGGQENNEDRQDAVSARGSQSRTSSRGSSTSGGSLKRSRSRASSRSSVGSAPVDSISRFNRPGSHGSSHALHTVEGQPAFALPGLPMNSPISAGGGLGLVPQIGEPPDGVISPSPGRPVDEQRLRVLVADYFPEMEQHNIESAYFSIPSHEVWEQRFALHELALRRARSDIRAHFASAAASFSAPGFESQFAHLAAGAGPSTAMFRPGSDPPVQTGPAAGSPSDTNWFPDAGMVPQHYLSQAGLGLGLGTSIAGPEMDNDGAAAENAVYDSTWSHTYDE
ncbi:hypothetical protein DFJ74DRAFT_84343 [Hyaloraphidium curvatum]|nr:hypothetical protein DFJ74DRAFT_84343 [Hyaloraphidium curvatum]